LSGWVGLLWGPIRFLLKGKNKMARQLASRVKHETGKKITTKTAYGTTSDMVVTDENILMKINTPEGVVLVKDDCGYYFTPENRVDTNLADPNRYANNRDIITKQVMDALSSPN